MGLRNFWKIAIVAALIPVFGMAACSQKEADKQLEPETQITEAVKDNAGENGNVGIVENAGEGENTERGETAGTSTTQRIILTKEDLTGDGAEDSVWVEEMDETGLMKGLYLTFGDESGEISLKVPEYIEICCYTKRSTEISVSCEQFSLGTTTLAEKPASGTTGAYLEKTFGAKKDGNQYRITVNADEFALIDADNHKGSAFWCRGKLCVEEKEVEVIWTVEYSLGELLVTSVELPLWNISGTDTGWENARAEWTERQKEIRYIGYLDESDFYKNIDSRRDFDGDGSIDRIWKNVTENGESYSIRFGNGETFLITDEIIGDRINCNLLKLSEDKSAFWFEDSGSGTGGIYTRLYLFEQTESGLKPMELPEGPVLKAEAVSEREICLVREGDNQITTFYFSLDSDGAFVNMTVEEWMEEYTSEEEGARILKLNGYDSCFITEGSVPEREAIRWELSLGNNTWGRLAFAWKTEYMNETWKITDFWPMF